MEGIIEGLIIAWILNLFGFGTLFINGLNNLFGLNISIASYYLIFAVIGLIFGISNRTISKSIYRKINENKHDPMPRQD